jgi:aminoglycoside phosphotransferase (APT) family kinase protein
VSEARGALARARERAAHELGMTDGRMVGRGLESEVWRMHHPEWGEVAVRLPASEEPANDNDPEVDPAALHRHEAAVYAYLAGTDIPVPRSYALLRFEVDVAVCEYIENDGSGFDSADLGRLLARLHALPPMPTIDPSRAADAFRAAIVERLVRRWGVLRRVDPTLPEPPPADRLAALVPAAATSLLHLDVRAENVLSRDGKIRALIDWTNSMIGDPALELARAEQYAAYPENGLDLEALLRGYATLRPLPARSERCTTLYRLDAAVMLALVFTREQPDSARGGQALARVHALLEGWDAGAGGAAGG